MIREHSHANTTVSQLSFAEVTKSYGEHVVLDQISFTVRTGEKVGVIGENGSGKSTLMRLIAGVEPPDNGDVTVVAGGGIGHLGQTLELPGDNTVADAIDAALADLRELERLMREAEATLESAGEAELAAYGDLLSAYEARGGYEADARVDAAMHGLGLAHLTRDRLLGTLSGGEQSRLGLACVLAADPELLLLDEPTNHLDTQAVSWLEDRLRQHRGTVVAVTHDRAFLAAITSTILEVDRDLRSVTRYGDGWKGYLTAKATAKRRWEQDYQDWCDEIERLTEATETNASLFAAKIKSVKHDRSAGHRRSHEAGLSSKVRESRERLRRLRENPVPEPPKPLRFAARFDGGKGEGLAAELIDVRVGDRLHVDKFRLAPGQRMLLTGPNGAGKTTLLRVLARDLKPDSGTVRRPKRLGYLRQELADNPPRRTVLAAFAEGLPGEPDEHVQTLESLGLLSRSDFTKLVPDLSIGQRRRLELARLVTRPADLLVLDEPSNHLSLALVGELEEALREFKGSLLVVSHDRSFAEGFDGDRVELRDGRLVEAM